MNSHTGTVGASCGKSNGARPLRPQQALLLAIIKRDHDGATAAISSGAEPMALARSAIEARRGHVEFLLLHVDANRKQYIEAMASRR